MDENLKQTEETQFSTTPSEMPKKKYDNEPYVIIENEEQLWKYTGRKIKKSWINNRNQLKTVTFILLKKLEKDPTKYMYVKIVNKKSQEEKLTDDISSLFKKGVLCYLSYISEDVIREKLLLKEQNFNF